ncbi:metallophosphoesterase family protein [Bradyrhizobium sp. WSM471]|uniref:metallophosphoesterase family protein n=1 Tax=Bradyrhizobium sp. WSM471 TaxID=319017 RepID=UPI00024D240A|nr:MULTISPECIES: metallophosphoesterase family protein [Bradyrhizobium]EHR01490.1 Calcineurin-like phosphoesterase [Bradyrhizobium sp. WSM471]UFW43543.1 serine/threonine protein phosphatase [Bradyrhizobium canariense]
MTLGELALVVCAQVVILGSIGALKLHAWRSDVLNRNFSSSSWRDQDGSLEASSNPPSFDAPGHDGSFKPRFWQTFPEPVLTMVRLVTGQLARPRRLDSARRLRPAARSGSAHPMVFDAGRSIRIPAGLPTGVRIYAIGDIHGRADLLRSVLENINSDYTRSPAERPILVFLGDYIDRGPSSKDVLDILVECKARIESVFLKGNHETFVLAFLQDPTALDSWRTCGGLETLHSYGLKPTLQPDMQERIDLAVQLATTLPDDHRAFLGSLQTWFQCGDVLFVHAGIRPNIPIAQQDESDLLWIREDFLDFRAPFEAFVVHGHTPVRVPDVRTNRLNIDTGAFVTGRLTCVAIEGSAVRQISELASNVGGQATVH